MNMQRFSGKTALVTGAASGIGLATVERLAREGAQVLACDINATKLNDEVARLQSAGLAVVAQALDVTDATACAAAVQNVVTAHGHFDVLCNVAGTLFLKDFTAMTDAEWHQQTAINLHGPFYLCRAAMPHLLKSKGNIVNVASIAGMVGVPYGSVYSAAKGGLLMLSRALAVEYGSRGVRVNAICPGSVATPLVEGFSPPENADFNLLSRLMPLLQEHGQPAGIAATIAFIASEEARFMTGAGVVIDGGQTAI